MPDGPASVAKIHEYVQVRIISIVAFWIVTPFSCINGCHVLG
jgi:hypothetical protein